MIVAGLLCGCDAGRDISSLRPNVIVVSIDTLRADHLGAYGYQRDTSKHIDDLADASVVFEQAYSQSPRTAPSHMTIFYRFVPGCAWLAQLVETPGH
jgi:glucan phosphoethanolaminetransferase (alkaline phosphatase superfamily)